MTKFSRLKPASIVLSLGVVSLLLAGCSTASDSPSDPNDSDLSGATNTVTEYLKAVDDGDSKKALTYVSQELPTKGLDVLLSDDYLKEGEGIKVTLSDPTSENSGEARIEGTAPEGKVTFTLVQEDNDWTIKSGAFQQVNVPANEFVPEIMVDGKSVKLDPTLYQQSGETVLSGFLTHYTIAPTKDSKLISFSEITAPQSLSVTNAYDVSLTTAGETELTKQANAFIDNCYAGGLSGDERTVSGCPNVRVFGPTTPTDTSVVWGKTSENPNFTAEYKNGKVTVTSPDTLTQSYTFFNGTFDWPVNMSGTATNVDGKLAFSFVADPIDDNLIEGVSL